MKITLFDGKEWTILDHSLPKNSQGLGVQQEHRAQQADALEAYYKRHGLKLKWTWRATPEANQYIARMQKNLEKQ